MNKIQKELKSSATQEGLHSAQNFFKNGKGEYGEGDIFIGVRMGDVRAIAKEYQSTFHTDRLAIEELLYSKIHEDRLCALVVLVINAKKHRNPKTKEARERQKEIVDFYLKHKSRINNWDLVDVSAHYVLGQYILDNPKERIILDTLIISENIWDRRIAMVSTWIMNREGQIDETLHLSKKLLGDKEDLMHKASGWMLREAWKKDPLKVEDFLKKYYDKLARTTLRYAIEKMEEKKRKNFLSKTY